MLGARNTALLGVSFFAWGALLSGPTVQDIGDLFVTAGGIMETGIR